jgi:transcriptional regulator with XRE-family HTH domain
MPAMARARRLVAMGSLWIVLMSATASIAAADEPGSPSADCPRPVLLGLTCGLDLPLPLPDLPIDLKAATLVPAELTEPVEPLLSLTEELPLAEKLPLAEVPGPVSGALAPPPTEGATVEGAASQPQQSPPTALTEPAVVPRSASAQLEADPGARRDHPTRAIDLGHAIAGRVPDTERPAVVGHSSPMLGGGLSLASQPFAAAVALTLTLGGGASLAADLARGGGGAWAGVVAFNVWLRRQLREARMSQRQLAAFSGVDHSTISRLMSGGREPSLATATKLASALRQLHGMPHAGDYFASLPESSMLATRRVEAALLGDDELDDQDVRELMHAYVTARARRRRERAAAAENGGGTATEGRKRA